MITLTNHLIILLFCFVLPATQFCYAQNYLTTTYNENDGLTNSVVYAVAQDQPGQLWFATRGGISVFDGNEWHAFSLKDGLPVASYSKITIDEQGLIWILSHPPGLSVSCFNGQHWETLTKPDFSVNTKNFSALEVGFRNEQRVIFVGTNDAGLLQFVDGQWRQITMEQGLPGNQINALAFHAGQLFIATDGGLAVFKDNQVSGGYSEIQLPSQRLLGMVLEKTDDAGNFRLWLAGENWLGFIEKMTFHLFTNTAKSIFDTMNHRLHLQPDLHGGIFYGNIFDLYHIQKPFGEIEHLGRTSGLITEGVTSFLIDREKNLWITSLRGVSQIQSQRFRNYRQVHGLLENEVTALAEIEPGKLVLGHENGLTFFENNQFRTRSFLKEKSNSEVTTRVLDLKVDADKNIWVAASMLGLARIHPSGKIDWFRKEAGLEGIVTTILIDSQSQIWVADSQGLHRFNGKKFELINLYPNRFETRGNLFPVIRKLFPGPDQSIYLATSGDGVYLKSKNLWTHFLAKDEQPANNVFFIFHDSQSRLWMGTLAGLFTLENNQIVKYQANGFQIDRPVYLILEDAKQRLWFGTDNGVIRWDGENTRVYTTRQGFVGQETNRSAGRVDAAGQVWIGADQGVSVYLEKFDYAAEDLPPPVVEITRLEVFDRTLSPNQPNQLDYRENTLVFHFKGISFADKKSLQYRFRLQGYDRNWQLETNHKIQEVRYTNLRPGKYKFQIQGRHEHGRWSAEQSSNQVVIQAPFWKTLWFRTLSILAGIALLAVVILSRISIFKKKQLAQHQFSQKLITEIEKGRKRIANELHDSLGQNLLIVRNEIQHCLHIIPYSEGGHAELNEISGIVTESIEELRQIANDLHPHLIDRLGLATAIESNIKKIAKTTGLDFDYQLDKIDNLLPKELEIHIFRIIQEALNNIVKHAAAKFVQIRVQHTDGFLKLLIQDDGRGFSYKKYLAEESRQSGLGISGMAERINLFAGEFSLISVPGKGTRIKIKIPIKRKIQ
jgi:signal transduction histidine kinase/ligand-binding sensor domain-containing protein